MIASTGHVDVANDAVVEAIALDAGAECEPEWVPTFGGPLGMSNSIEALIVFDDGSGAGPALYAGGAFTTAGGVSTNRVARWNGTEWTPLGQGLDSGFVYALTIFDDGLGGGPALYAAGDFTTTGGATVNRVARWSGTSWTPLGTGMNGTVRALTVFDDGSGGGPALYAGGSFTTAGGAAAVRVAKWNGASWAPLGAGITSTLVSPAVQTLAVFDDGSGGGPALYAGGNFNIAGGAPASNIARWNGATWTPVDGGMDNDVQTLSVFNDGSGGGPALYAGGTFTAAGGGAANRVARWNGSTWAPLGSGMDGGIRVLASLDDGSGGGPALYAGGDFTSAGGVAANRIARWNGAVWTPLGAGMNGGVRAIATFDDGSGGGPALYAGGFYSDAAGMVVNSIARWDDMQWTPLGTGLNGTVLAMIVFDDGSGGGPALFAAGSLTAAGGAPANRIARWNGMDWTTLGTGLDGTIQALAIFDDGLGGGPALYAGGTFLTAGALTVNRIARWNGTTWEPLGSGMNGFVYALAVYDDGSGGGPALYAGGNFTTADGVATNRIARWDGKAWTPLGIGTSGGINTVRALTVFDDGLGGGPALYAGGSFWTAGGVTVNRIARWDGKAWTALGSGMDSEVLALTVFDAGLGGGPELCAGGWFTSAGGAAANYVARWNGATWAPLGSGMDNSVFTLTTFDDGTGGGAALYAGGTFTSAGGAAAGRIARWDGASWTPLGSGFGTFVHSLAEFDGATDDAAALYVGGLFTTSPAGDAYLARWQGCPDEPRCEVADLNCDGFVNGVDLAILLGHWGPCVGCVADINEDGVVNGADLAILLGHWS